MPGCWVIDTRQLSPGQGKMRTGHDPDLGQMVQQHGSPWHLVGGHCGVKAECKAAAGAEGLASMSRHFRTLGQSLMSA